MSHQSFFILDAAGNPIPVSDISEWAQWMALHGRFVQQDDLPNGIAVSTVFLGVGRTDRGPPALWETMIFGGPHSHYQERYASLREAKAGHRLALAKARNLKLVSG